MKKFKIITTFMVIALLLLLSACGTSKTSGSAASSAKKTLRVVTDASYAPFEYMDKGQITGFDVDFINAVAKEAGYKNIYLETMPELKQALKTYEKFGFEYMNHPMGNSGHFGCELWMLKRL